MRRTDFGASSPRTQAGSGRDIVADCENLMSDAFRTFTIEIPEHARAWMAAAQGLDSASVLGKKTEHLAYLAVLAALRLIDGVPFHVALAKEDGATRQEIARAVLIGLPAAGSVVIHALPAELEAFDRR